MQVNDIFIPKTYFEQLFPSSEVNFSEFAPFTCNLVTLFYLPLLRGGSKKSQSGHDLFFHDFRKNNAKKNICPLLRGEAGVYILSKSLNSCHLPFFSFEFLPQEYMRSKTYQTPQIIENSSDLDHFKLKMRKNVFKIVNFNKKFILVPSGVRQL